MSYIQSNGVGTTITPTTANPGTATTYTLPAVESGKIIRVNPAQTAVGGNTLVIYLPALAQSAGLRYKLVVGIIGTAITANTILIRIGSGAGVTNLIGVVSNNVTAGTGTSRGLGLDTPGTTLAIVPITLGATGAQLGDSIDFWSDGLYWYYNAYGALAGAFTIV